MNFVLNIIFCWIFLSYAQALANNIQEVIPTFEKILNQASKKEKIPGFAIGIVNNGRVVYLKGFGYTSFGSKQPITPDTVFQLASLSKTISGALIGILNQHDYLTLEDLVSEYLPSFSLQPGQLKIQHVATHTSGVPRHGFASIVESHNHNKRAIIDYLATSKPICLPGACYDYHNTCFGLLEDIVKEATKKEFSENLHNYLLKPLKMNKTTMSYEDLLKETNKAWPHNKDAKGNLIKCKNHSPWYYKIVPAGGINSSARDMTQFIIAQLGYRPDIMTKKTLSLIYTPYTEAKDFFIRNPRNSKRFKSSHYGIGWRILEYEDQKILFHGGLVKGFHNIIALLPEKDIGIIILQNSATSFSWNMTMTFF